MQYSLLIYSAEGFFERLPQDEQDRVMQGHHDLQATLAGRGDFSSVKLMGTSSAITLQPTEPGRDGPPIVKDGPFAETKERLMGFYTFDADSLEEATALASKIASPYVRLEIRPVAWAGGILSAE